MKYLGKNSNELVDIMVDNLIETIWDYGVYVEWKTVKIYKEFEVELNAMNCLIRNSNFKKTFIDLLSKVPSVVTVFPLLLAIKKVDRKKMMENSKTLRILNATLEIDEYNFSKEKAKKGFNNEEINWYYNFFKESGLEKLCSNLMEKSFVDYVIGILVGMDTHGRKNRSGKKFEKMCKEIIEEISKKNNLEVYTQVQFKTLRESGFEISEDIENRKADFIIRKDDKLVNIEADFFNADGSKPEEIIDSYINRKKELKQNNIDFVLLTDGLCWDNKNKSQLIKAFNNLIVMNYTMAKEGYLEEAIQYFFSKEYK